MTGCLGEKCAWATGIRAEIRGPFAGAMWVPGMEHKLSGLAQLTWPSLAISEALEHVCFQMSSKSPCSGPGCLLSSDGREEKQLRVLKTHCSFEKSWNWTNRGYYCSSWGLKTPTPQRMGSSSQTLSYSVPAFATRSPPLWWATFVGLPPARLLDHHYWVVMLCYAFAPLAFCYFLLSL